MVQVPALTPVTLLPLTVQTLVVEELYVTASAEVAVAETVSAPPTAIVGAAPKLMVWPAFPMVMDFVTCAAAV